MTMVERFMWIALDFLGAEKGGWVGWSLGAFTRD